MRCQVVKSVGSRGGLLPPGITSFRGWWRSVRVTGSGGDDEAMNMLFEPFYTTKRGSGGSGLGTHLVYNLVTSALHGKITVKSQVGKGLAFLIKFPVS